MFEAPDSATLIIWTVMYAFGTPLGLLWAFVFGFALLGLGTKHASSFLSGISLTAKIAFATSIRASRSLARSLSTADSAVLLTLVVS